MTRRPQLFGKTLFADFLLSNLAMLLGLMMLSNVSHKQKQQAEEKAGLRTEGKYAITMSWPDGSGDDVDLYVRDPRGNLVFFNARDLGLMHLDHDDQGSVSDKAMTEGGEVKIDKNEERVVLRGTMRGEYVVNVHMYNKRDPRPTPVTIRLYRLKGEDAEVIKKVRILNAKEETTAFRFSLKSDGSLGEVNEIPRSLMGGAQ